MRRKKDINFRFEDADLTYANFCTLISFIEMHEGKLMVLKVSQIVRFLVFHLNA